MKRELRDLLRQISDLEHTLRTEEGRVMLLARIKNSPACSTASTPSAATPRSKP